VLKAKRGFALMDRDRQRELARKGGRAAHEKGTAHRWSGEEAKEAGRKGGAASHRNGHRTWPREELETAEPSANEQSLEESSAKDPKTNPTP
jgi:general stress protein YciG